MHKLYRVGIATLLGLTSSLTLPSQLPPAQAQTASIEENYTFGLCTIDTGSSTRQFHCYTSPSRGTGVFFFDIVTADEQLNFNQTNRFGTFIEQLNTLPHPTLFRWTDGSEESVRGSNFDPATGQFIF